ASSVAPLFPRELSQDFRVQRVPSVISNRSEWDGESSQPGFFQREHFRRDVLVPVTRYQYHLERSERLSIGLMLDVGREWRTPDDQTVGSYASSDHPTSGGGGPL